MHQPSECCEQELIEGLASLQSEICGLQRSLLTFVREYDRRKLWRRDGCRHMGQWLAGHLGVSVSEGLRWTTAAHALEHLPLIADAFERGVLSLDKVLQLARFATPGTEQDLLGWARRASVAAIRHRADLANHPSVQQTRSAFEERYLQWWWWDDGTRLGIEGVLPADDGAAVVKALETIAERQSRVPSRPPFEQRCADALVALASGADQASGWEDSSPGPKNSLRASTSGGSSAGFGDTRAEVLLNADLSALRGGEGGCHFDGGPAIHPEVARRIACDCRLRTVLRDPGGRAVGIGRRSRTVPHWLLRELLSRDHGCTFPGCGTRRFLAAHHDVHWAHGGATELDNLVLVCSFHHRLVHEGGWKVTLIGGLLADWSRPNGSHYDPALPRGTISPESDSQRGSPADQS